MCVYEVPLTVWITHGRMIASIVPRRCAPFLGDALSSLPIENVDAKSLPMAANLHFFRAVGSACRLVLYEGNAALID